MQRLVLFVKSRVAARRGRRRRRGNCIRFGRMHCSIARVQQRPFIAQQNAPLCVRQHRRDGRGLAIHRHAPPDQARALAVIHPRGRVPEVKRLDRRAVQAMPAVDGDFVRRVDQPAREHQVLLVPCHQRAQRMRRQNPGTLPADDFVVLLEDRHGGHPGTGRDRHGREFDGGGGIDVPDHARSGQDAIQLVRQRLRRGRRNRDQEIIIIRPDGKIVGRHFVNRGCVPRLHRARDRDGDKVPPKIGHIAACDFRHDLLFACGQIQGGDPAGKCRPLGRVRRARRQRHITRQHRA